MVRVLIADDHAVVRAGLRLLIDAQPDMRVIGEAADGDSALREGTRARPDVVVLDLSMPGIRGSEVIRQLANELPSARVVVLTMHDDPAHVRSALAAGAAGYVVKKAADRDLINAIRAVDQGRSYIDVDAASALGALLPASSGEGLLSPRETQVLKLLARGHTNREIADILEIGVKSAETYRARVRSKLGASSRAELVRAAIDAGISMADGTDAEPAGD